MCARNDRTSATDITTSTSRIGSETTSRPTCMTLMPPSMNISVTGSAPIAKAQKTRCHLAGLSPAGRCSVALDANVYDAES